MRLVFLASDPPIFLTTDSMTYALPANHLATGQGFDLSLRRTPGYPLFLATLWTLFSFTAAPVIHAHHAPAIMSAGLAWPPGPPAFGRLVPRLGRLALSP